MAAKAKKVMVIGLDAPIAPRLYRFAMDGKLPALKKVIENGVFAQNCIVPYPTITPPNWTTIVTGATLGTHGVTCFNVHKPGDPLTETHPGFRTEDCQAEYVWDAAEKVGKRTIIVNYPCGVPCTLKTGIQIAGGGLSLNEDRSTVAQAGIGFYCNLAHEQLFAADEYPQCTPIQLQAASGWTNLPENKTAQQAELKLRYPRSRYKIEDRTWHVALLDTTGNGFDAAILSESKDASEAFATLKEGQWTGTLVHRFKTNEGPKKAAFRVKLVKLAPDASEFKLYVTPLCALEGWSHPPNIAKHIKSENGLPMPHGGFQAFNMGWIDAATFLEVRELEHNFLADAATQLLTKKRWHLFFMHAHCPDHCYHGFGKRLDPLTAASPEEAAECQRVELAFYQSLDRMIEKILKCADDQTLVMFVSDHGAKATTRPFPVQKVLADAGLVQFVKTDAPAPQPPKPPQIDWTRTQAIQQRSCYVYVNLKGRDPGGIVEPGAEYEQVRDQIIAALYNYTDPETGKKPIALALRREDARILGLHGDRVGDVVYALTPHYGGQHGNLLPTAQYGVGDLRGLFIMAGPGVKKDFLMERTMGLQDVVPTLCHLAGFPVPRHCEGAILYQALEPDA